MKIIVKYSLSFRENVHVNEETLEIERDSITVLELLEAIARRHPSMHVFLDTQSDEAQRRHLTVAVNSRLARLADGLSDGDRISLLLPVVGGSEE